MQNALIVVEVCGVLHDKSQLKRYGQILVDT